MRTILWATVSFQGGQSFLPWFDLTHHPTTTLSPCRATFHPCFPPLFIIASPSNVVQRENDRVTRANSHISVFRTGKQSKGKREERERESKKRKKNPIQLNFHRVRRRPFFFSFFLFLSPPQRELGRGSFFRLFCRDSVDEARFLLLHRTFQIFSIDTIVRSLFCSDLFSYIVFLFLFF